MYVKYSTPNFQITGYLHIIYRNIGNSLVPNSISVLRTYVELLIESGEGFTGRIIKFETSVLRAELATKHLEFLSEGIDADVPSPQEMIDRSRLVTRRGFMEYNYVSAINGYKSCTPHVDIRFRCFYPLISTLFHLAVLPWETLYLSPLRALLLLSLPPARDIRPRKCVMHHHTIFSL